MREYEGIATEEELKQILHPEEKTQLYSLRKAKKMPRTELARISGVANQIIYNYETRRRDINIASSLTLCKLATALGCRIEDLMDKQVVSLVKQQVENQQAEGNE